MARAFHEMYGIKPYVYGKYPTGYCYQSKIMHYRAVKDIDKQDTFLDTVIKFSDQNKDKTILLIGCGDSYVQLISANKDNFPKNIVAPYIDVEMMNDLIHKEKFYNLCEKAGVDY